MTTRQSIKPRPSLARNFRCETQDDRIVFAGKDSFAIDAAHSTGEAELQRVCRSEPSFCGEDNHTFDAPSGDFAWPQRSFLAHRCFTGAMDVYGRMSGFSLDVSGVSNVTLEVAYLFDSLLAVRSDNAGIDQHVVDVYAFHGDAMDESRVDDGMGDLVVGDFGPVGLGSEQVFVGIAVRLFGYHDVEHGKGRDEIVERSHTGHLTVDCRVELDSTNRRTGIEFTATSDACSGGLERLEISTVGDAVSSLDVSAAKEIGSVSDARSQSTGAHVTRGLPISVAIRDLADEFGRDLIGLRIVDGTPGEHGFRLFDACSSFVSGSLAVSGLDPSVAFTGMHVACNGLRPNSTIANRLVTVEIAFAIGDALQATSDSLVVGWGDDRHESWAMLPILPAIEYLDGSLVHRLIPTFSGGLRQTGDDIAAAIILGVGDGLNVDKASFEHFTVGILGDAGRERFDNRQIFGGVQIVHPPASDRLNGLGRDAIVVGSSSYALDVVVVGSTIRTFDSVVNENAASADWKLMRLPLIDVISGATVIQHETIVVLPNMADLDTIMVGDILVLPGQTGGRFGSFGDAFRIVAVDPRDRKIRLTTAPRNRGSSSAMWSVMRASDYQSRLEMSEVQFDTVVSAASNQPLEVPDLGSCLIGNAVPNVGELIDVRAIQIDAGGLLVDPVISVDGRLSPTAGPENWDRQVERQPAMMCEQFAKFTVPLSGEALRLRTEFFEPIETRGLAIHGSNETIGQDESVIARPASYDALGWDECSAVETVGIAMLDINSANGRVDAILVVGPAVDFGVFVDANGQRFASGESAFRSEEMTGLDFFQDRSGSDNRIRSDVTGPVIMGVTRSVELGLAGDASADLDLVRGSTLDGLSIELLAWDAARGHWDVVSASTDQSSSSDGSISLAGFREGVGYRLRVCSPNGASKSFDMPLVDCWEIAHRVRDSSRRPSNCRSDRSWVRHWERPRSA